jgi:hypothetical protein
MSLLGRRVAFLGLAMMAVAMAPIGPAAGQTPDTARPSSRPSVNIKIATVTVRDLAFELPGRGRWTIGSISFTGLVRSGTRVLADRIEIDNVVVVSGAWTIEIPSIVMSGADLPEALVPIPAASGPINDLAALLTSATVDEVTIARMIHRDPATRVEITYTGFTFAGLKGGIVASLRIAQSLATMPGVPGTTDPVHVRMGEIRYQQFDLAEMVRMINGTGRGDAKRLLERVVVDGIDVTGGKAVIRIDRVELADIDGRAPDRPPPAPLQVPTGAPAGALDPEQQKQAAAYAIELLRYGRIGRYTIEGLNASVPGQGSLSLGAIVITGLSGRGVDRIEISDLDLRSPGARARFERFELAGINYGALVEAALDAARSGSKLAPQPGQIAQLMPRLSAIRLSRLDLDTPKGPVTLGDMRFEQTAHGEMTNVAYAIRDLKVDLRRLDAGGGRDHLMALGYQDLVAGAQARVSLQSKNRAIVIETAGLSLDQIGKLDITARLEDVDIDKAMADPMAGEALLEAAHIGPIELRLADLGLAARFYTHAAKSAGVSSDAVRAGLAAEVRAQAVAMFGPALAGRSADAIAQFLQSPGSITARITPAAGQPPLSVADVKRLAPPELMQRLTITLEAAPRKP